MAEATLMMAKTSYGDAMSSRYDADFAATFGGSDRGDIAFFQALARATRGPICEVGAGTGRVLLAVAEIAGRRSVTGVEPSAAMRERFTARQGERPRWRRVAMVDGSFEAIPLLNCSQGLVFSAFRSFQHVLTSAGQLRALGEMLRVLRPGAALALDFFDPALHHLRSVRPLVGLRYRTGEGTTLERWESRRVDRVAQCVEVTFRWVERQDDGRLVRDESATYAVRYTFPVELEHLLAPAGFVDIEVRGDYDGRPLGPTPRELVVVCRRPQTTKRSGAKASR